VLLKGKEIAKEGAMVLIKKVGPTIVTTIAYEGIKALFVKKPTFNDKASKFVKDYGYIIAPVVGLLVYIAKAEYDDRRQKRKTFH
jgi:hypothetical protein